MGYAGGLQSDPSYRNMGDHTETVQVDFDPERISYTRLLDIFWKSHDPMTGSWGKQYMHAVFYHDERQRQRAQESKRNIEERGGRAVQTRVLPMRSFTMAEDYHQKYLLKQDYRLKREIDRIYPDHRDLVESTAAARLNGYAGGNGSNRQLAGELDRLGLSEAGKRALVEMVRRREDYNR